MGKVSIEGRIFIKRSILMRKVLNIDQTRELAFAMYSYFGEKHPTRLGLKAAYAGEKRGSERNFERKMENEGAKLSEEECFWVVENLARNIDPLPLTNIFLRTVGDTPEVFGYQIPQIEPPQFDTSLPPKTLHERWKNGELVKKGEPV